MKFATGRPVAILSEKTAKSIAVYAGERIRVKTKHSIVCIVDIAQGMLKENEIALSAEVMKALGITEGFAVDVNAESPPHTINFILDKLKGKPLNSEQIFQLVGDIVHNTLTEAEIAAFVSAVYINGMNEEEITNLIKSMVAYGRKLNLKEKVYDKHSIGGIAGNRTTPLIVSICAAAGIKIPKTSSRAITSAAGTADVVETFAKIEFTVEEIRKILQKTNGCMVWGGSLGLAPADDKLIQVERLISIDPEAQLIASILAKKLAIGAKGIILDIPYGESAKVRNKAEGKRLGERFRKIAKMLNLNVVSVVTDGTQPIGNGIGPILEAKDILKVLRREEGRPVDLEKKAVYISSLIIEMAGKARKGKGLALAKEILDSNRAYQKFIEIIEAQGGSIEGLDKRLTPAKFSYTIKSACNGKVKSIDNKKIAKMAKVAGCPADKASGLYLHVHVGDKVEKCTPLITIYADTEEKVQFAKEDYGLLSPIEFK